MKDLGTEILETNRLNLRKFCIDDYRDMYNNWASSELVAVPAGFTKHENEDITKEVIENWINEYSGDHIYNWVVTLKENSMPIGSATVVKKDLKNEVAEIGYAFGEKFWNKGYATEVLELLVKYLIKEVGFYTLEAKVAKSNIASTKVLAKVGFKYEGELFNRRKNASGRENLLIYSVSADDIK